MNKSNSGITLIALVITIIVLLILAGITISMLLGETGMITKANQAKRAHEKAYYTEALELIILDKKTGELVTPTDRLFSEILTERIKEETWVKQVSRDELEDIIILIVETKDGYELMVEVDEVNRTAKVIDYYEKAGKKYTIKYDSNGGQGNKQEEEVRGGTYTLLAKNSYTKAGYKFTGWSEKQDGTGEILAEGSKYKPEKEITLYAIWEINTVTIHFDKNGGNGTLGDITVTGDVSTKLPQNTYTYTGYLFKQWNTSQDGSGQAYTNGSNITVNENTTLYAIWEENVIATLELTIPELNRDTQIKVSATSLALGIEKVEVKLNNEIIYTVSNPGTNKQDTITLGTLEQSGSINVVQKLTFNNLYDCSIIATGKSGKQVTTIKKIRNYTIHSKNDLKILATQANEGNTFSQKTISQERDIDLQGNQTDQWIPIGTTSEGFKGKYLGQKHKIDGIYINNSLPNQGLFSKNYGTIENLIVNSGTITTTVTNNTNGSQGAIVSKNYGKIISCYNAVTVESNKFYRTWWYCWNQ